MNFNLSEKGLRIAPSITLEITAKAKAMKESGIDVVSFGAGEPDFNTPENIQQEGIRAIKEGLTRYTPASGILELKKAICAKLKKDNGLEYKTNNIIISSGAKHSIHNALMAILNPGDEVIFAVPYWVSYPELVRLADGVPVHIETKEENDFKFNIDDLNKALTNKTKAIILNSPSNPTGSIYTEEELRKIADWAVKNNIFIISDEIYEKLVYDNNKHVCIASFNEDIKRLTILINGMSKAYAMTGWRIGYAAAHEDIIKVMSNIQSHATSNPCSISQYASIEGLIGDQSSVEEMKKHFVERRNYMVETINSIKGLSCRKPQGAFYIMINFTQLLGKTIKGKVINSSLDFASLLLEEGKVAVVPGIAFGDDKYVRLSYATSMENIKKGLERIKQIVEE
ncbi:pyridoxal phosphate-dependent aminotransferase [Tissierella praeacuta]|uniref:Aminotransferase n=1 Tax=Tissierella praeacuta DSM 18095 TaxID=1123404 RepID=A0A1M4SH25_9FIRM|nr:pyridoxal phosphate-dependent aminotransferase [Tissierella praeacuta]MBU5254822.1 pyridoxal phosphate-dependent aminotransferase [Tissierella praeacuta]TCU72720.1 aspartate aminotransferase [Tissierella praeacuta]SHE31500.1 aspartate aminotransferase [Tissierella praeacuta DSM 18095]SUP01422.1 Aspartate aminotransferase [Tissierella praeacuta]